MLPEDRARHHCTAGIRPPLQETSYVHEDVGLGHEQATNALWIWKREKDRPETAEHNLLAGEPLST